MNDELDPSLIQTPTLVQLALTPNKLGAVSLLTDYLTVIEVEVTQKPYEVIIIGSDSYDSSRDDIDDDRRLVIYPKGVPEPLLKLDELGMTRHPH